MGQFAGSLTGVIAAPPTIEQNTEIYQWQCPAGVTSVSVIMIAGGGTGGLNYGAGGGGGALAYGNNIPVIPGQIYYVGVGLGGQNVTTLGVTTINPQDKNTQYGFGGDSYFISPAMLNAGGGKPGIAGKGGTPGGGGGAGGYIGAGGNGGAANVGTSTTATKFAGGAGGAPSGKYLVGGGAGGAGGQACSSNYPCDAATGGTGGASGGGAGGFNGALGGGGTGINGQTNDGAGGGNTLASRAGTKTLNGGSIPTALTGSPAGYDNNTVPSRPGISISQTVVSGGTSTTYPDPFLNLPLSGGVKSINPEGGMYGGGGAGTASIYSGGRGVVRIIWGASRSFPNTNVTDQTITTDTGQITYIAQIGPVPLPSWPVAYNANVTVYENTTEDIITVTYDNPSNLKANLYMVSQPAYGSAFMYSNTSIKYTPTLNYLGIDTFMYQIQNSYGNSFPAMVTVNVVNPDVIQTLYLNCTINTAIGISSGSLNYVTGVVTNPSNAVLKFVNTDGFLNLFGSNSTSMSAKLNWTTFMNYVTANNLYIDTSVGITLTKSFIVSYTGYTAVFSVVINVTSTIPAGTLLSSNCIQLDLVETYADGNGGTYSQTTKSSPQCIPPAGTLLSVYCKIPDQWGIYSDGVGGKYTQLIQSNNPDCQPSFNGLYVNVLKNSAQFISTGKVLATDVLTIIPLNIYDGDPSATTINWRVKDRITGVVYASGTAPVSPGNPYYVSHTDPFTGKSVPSLGGTSSFTIGPASFLTSIIQVEISTTKVPWYALCNYNL